MYYRVLFIVIILLTLISTLCVSMIKPDMHKRVFVYNSEYVVQPEEVVTEEIIDIPTIAQEPEKEISVTPAPVYKPEEKSVTTAPVKKVTEQKVVTTPVKKQEKVVKTETVKKSEPVKSIQKYELPQSVKEIANNTYKQKPVTTQTTQTTKSEPVVTQTTQTQTPKTTVTSTPTQAPKPAQSNISVVKTPQKTVISTTNPQPSKTVKILSAAEEEIAWNKWRSDLQNKLMNDVVLPAVPRGTVFKFSFDVDKYGKITNIQTWSTTPQYTPYAIEHIAPVIRSYQGRPILNFPAGSQRVHTTASGAWKISNVSVYSSPSDYNDYEKVRK